MHNCTQVYVSILMCAYLYMCVLETVVNVVIYWIVI